MKNKSLLFAYMGLALSAALGQEAKVTPLVSKD